MLQNARITASTVSIIKGKPTARGGRGLSPPRLELKPYVFKDFSFFRILLFVKCSFTLLKFTASFFVNL